MMFGFKAQRQFRSAMSLDDGLVHKNQINKIAYWQLLFQPLAKHGHFKNYWLYKQSNLS